MTTLRPAGTRDTFMIASGLWHSDSVWNEGLPDSNAFVSIGNSQAALVTTSAQARFINNAGTLSIQSTLAADVVRNAVGGLMVLDTSQGRLQVQSQLTTHSLLVQTGGTIEVNGALLVDHGGTFQLQGGQLNSRSISLGISGNTGRLQLGGSQASVSVFETLGFYDGAQLDAQPGSVIRMEGASLINESIHPENLGGLSNLSLDSMG